MDRAEIQTRLQSFKERCRAAGMTATVQRIAIYKALLTHAGHPSPDEVYRAARRAVPALSVATVYKTLEAFDAAGIARIVNPLHKSARYDGRVDHHHHLVCLRCQRVEDLEPDAIRGAMARSAEGLSLGDEARRDFEVRDWQVTFRGVCRLCRQKRAPARRA
jgi:Fe2+ or Zn2+ uptake regulation protein